MAATVAKAWQRVQQKNLPPPLLPSRTTLTDNGLNKIVATKQQNPFNHVDKISTERNSTITSIKLMKN
jgi:hypothetical protein